MTRSNVIGEGTYGCVHKPSIHCEDPPESNFNYKNYVSKLMKTRNAQKELDEFIFIQNIDPTNKYHLGKPFICKPKIDDIKNEISKCKYIKLKDVEKNINNYKILIQKFGGFDLKSLCNNNLKEYLQKNKELHTDYFWFEVHNLIKGLQFFKKNGIVHNDIKPQNILFDPKNGKLKYIDFGLMKTKKNIIRLSKKSDNFLGIYHWSYPFDCGFMNKEEYVLYKSYDVLKRNVYKNELCNMIITNSKINKYDLPINNASSFKILFTYLNTDNTVPKTSIQYGYINSFFNGINKCIDTMSYDDVLNQIIDSIDVFGLGFSLQYIANCFYRSNALSLENYTILSSFFNKMWDFNPLLRVIDIDKLLIEYENIVFKMGILTRLNKSYSNDNKSFVPKNIMEMSVSDDSIRTEKLSPLIENMANDDPIKKTTKRKQNRKKNKTKKYR
jgi:serine/threonine protein kinase